MEDLDVKEGEEENITLDDMMHLNFLFLIIFTVALVFGVPFNFSSYLFFNFYNSVSSILYY